MPNPQQMGDIELLDWAKGEAWPRVGLAVRRVMEERDRMAAHVIRLTKELQELRKGKPTETLVGFASDGSVVEVPPSAPTVHDEEEPPPVKFDGSTGRLSDSAGKKTDGSGV